MLKGVSAGDHGSKQGAATDRGHDCKIVEVYRASDEASSPPGSHCNLRYVVLSFYETRATEFGVQERHGC